ncbi:glycine zipper 2TM domain-containing protein [Vibrio pacinii]|uniref:glycine zipper 2TM domain-containing protein n=1 Tax=Vibrio pacinii TaxID=170674 RepID=UPI000570A044|nr:glycine zipper 2TM domain-containing protein [Vibrio pacinii]
MKKWLWIILVFPLIANAAYERNSARPVNQVVFGQVDTVRYISEQEIIKSRANGWQTLLGAVIGGVIGHQFGGGTGQEVATAVGAVAGAGVARHHGQQEYQLEYQLVELLINSDDGQLIDVIQDVDNQMLFKRGDKVRILYFDNGVRVDKAY